VEEWGIFADFATGILAGNGCVSVTVFDVFVAGSPRHYQTKAAARR
jgi:hypothetical protein